MRSKFAEANVLNTASIANNSWVTNLGHIISVRYSFSGTVSHTRWKRFLAHNIFQMPTVCLV